MMSSSIRWSTAALMVLALSACSPPPEDDNGKRKSLAGEGLEETSTIRNTENIGYSGNAIGAKVDQAITTTENSKAEMDRQLEAQESAP